jgi:hypothetical protein
MGVREVPVALSTRHVTWLLLIGCCVALCAVFSLAFVCQAQGSPDLCLDQSDDPGFSTDETPCAPPPGTVPHLVAGVASHSRGSSPGLLPDTSIDPTMLAAAPGGLCLLI